MKKNYFMHFFFLTHYASHSHSLILLMGSKEVQKIMFNQVLPSVKWSPQSYHKDGYY